MFNVRVHIPELSFCDLYASVVEDTPDCVSV